MFQVSAIRAFDGYKADHRRQYPDDTTMVYSNLTPRKSRLDGVHSVVFFGLQYFIKHYLRDNFNETFFSQPRGEVVDSYAKQLKRYLGNAAPPVDHIGDLHDLGHLPLIVKAVPEGTIVPIRVPVLTIRNTDDRFFWLTNQLETLLSCTLWGPMTSATTAYEYRLAFNRYAEETGGSREMIKFQGHDFSFRGMFGLEAALLSGAAHLTSFAGTDTYPALDFIDAFYPGDNDLVGCSIPATEHSVMCMGTESAELDTYRRLIHVVYPEGPVAIVSDTWDFWSIMTKGLTELKDEIVARNGKVIIRPDSGDPVKIICGDPAAPEGSPERKGAVRVMYEIFGGTTNEKGFITLDSHIGLIYGDSITRERQEQILKRLANAGFASDCIVLGIGSYTYQYVTRDSLGMAVKSTYGEVNHVGRSIYKSPKTDKGGEKKSARGLIAVEREGLVPVLVDDVDWNREQGGILSTVFEDGIIKRHQSLSDIRQLLHGTNF